MSTLQSISERPLVRRGRIPARRNPRDARRLRRSLVVSAAVHVALIAGLFAVPALRAARRVDSRAVRATVALLEPTPPETWPDDVEPVHEIEEAPLGELPEAVPVPHPASDAPELDEPPPLDAFDLSPGRIERLAGNPRLGRPAREPDAADPQPPAPEVVQAEPTPAAPPRRTPAASASRARETPPVPIPGRCPRPTYPARAERLGQSGFVVCRITVGVDGRVVAVEMEASSGYEILDRAALDAVTRWEFAPGTRDGEPVEMDVRKRLWFRLDV